MGAKAQCGLCDHHEQSLKDLDAHYQLSHPGVAMPSMYFRKKQVLAAGRQWLSSSHGTGGDGTATASDTPAMDAIAAAETAIRRALRELDAERDALMSKVKAIDDKMNKYKHFTGGAA